MMRERSGSPDEELPTVETKPEHVSTGVEYVGSPAMRRHARKRSSTILIPPSPSVSQQPPTIAEEASKPSTKGLFRGATVLAGAQVVIKLLSFVLNQALLRFVAARDLGYAAQLDFFGVTVLALSRDAVRITSQRQHTRSDRLHPDSYRPDGRPVEGSISGTSQEAINLGWVATLVGVLLTVVIVTVVRLDSPTTRAAVLIYGLAVIVELASEPAYLLLQLQLRLDKRAKAEALGMAVRCLVALGLVAAAKSPPALAFACAQLAYSGTVSASYGIGAVVEHRHAAFSLLPRRVWIVNKLGWFDTQTVRLARGLALQEFIKYFLTEGDKLAVGLLTTLEQQGEYALAANYGSLVARLVLFPVEEALRTYFSRSNAESDSNDSFDPNTAPHSGKVDATSTSVNPGVPDPSLAPKEGLRRKLSRRIAPAPSRSTTDARKAESDAIPTLTTILRVYTCFGLIAAGFGAKEAPFIVEIVLAKPWLAESQASTVLSAYAWYLPVLAWNGALEAFVQCMASPSDFRHQGAAMTVLALVFVVLVYVFVDVLGFGAPGLVWAQLATMVLRIAWSSWFVTRWAQSTRWLANCVPRLSVLIYFVVVKALSNRYFSGAPSFSQLMVNGCLGVSVLIVAAAAEPSIRTMISNKAAPYIK